MLWTSSRSPVMVRNLHIGLRQITSACGPKQMRHIFRTDAVVPAISRVHNHGRSGESGSRGIFDLQMFQLFRHQTERLKRFIPYRETSGNGICYGTPRKRGRPSYGKTVRRRAVCHASHRHKLRYQLRVGMSQSSPARTTGCAHRDSHTEEPARGMPSPQSMLPASKSRAKYHV